MSKFEVIKEYVQRQNDGVLLRTLTVKEKDGKFVLNYDGGNGEKFKCGKKREVHAYCEGLNDAESWGCHCTQPYDEASPEAHAHSKGVEHAGGSYSEEQDS